MRPIDAEVFVKELKKFLITIHQTYLAEAVLRIVQKVIDKQPTIEAKPIVHAHWVTDFDFDPEEEQELYFYFCSNCKDSLFGDKEDFKYCPYCGAQMDEEVSETKGE